jgi:hypothetical protein
MLGLSLEDMCTEAARRPVEIGTSRPATCLSAWVVVSLVRPKMTQCGSEVTPRARLETDVRPATELPQNS